MSPARASQTTPQKPGRSYKPRIAGATVENFDSQYGAFVRSIGSGNRLRLAPTPSGYLHAGNAINFVLNWLAARAYPGARLLLRIDDLDADRKRPEYVRDVFETLSWLGLDWDEGPRDPEDFEKNWSQHLRLSQYFEVLEELRAGGWLFACDKSRRDLEPFNGKYPPAFRNQGLSLDHQDVAWRIRTPDNFPLPDFIVRRRDGMPAYQIGSLVDDRYFGITHVIRGADLQESTAAQLFLAECLRWRELSHIRFLHHPLLTDPTGAKLSKSAGSAALYTWRAEGRSPAPVFKQVANWIGIPAGEALTAEGLLQTLRNRLKE